MEYHYLRVFPVTFLPGVIAFTYWQIMVAADSAMSVKQPHSSRIDELASRPVAFVELLFCVSLILLYVMFLRPVFSQSRAQLLAEGVLLWNGQPVGGATVEFHPVLKVGRLGEPDFQNNQLRTNSDGQFLILTFPEWRKKNPTVGEFAVTVSLSKEEGLKGIPAKKMDAIRRFASPQDTPIRVTIVEGKRKGIRIELSEWCSPRRSTK